MTHVLIGAPSWKREWILRDWCLAADRAVTTAGADASFVLELDTRDQLSHELVKGVLADLGRPYETVWVNEDPQERRDRKAWTEVPGLHRYLHMVWLRNNLLDHVRKVRPDFYLSLDTDILLHPHALSNLLESAERFDAVGGKCYMTPAGVWAPSWAAIINGGSLLRYDSEDVMPVEAIMAIKLMKPSAYSVDYEVHPQGEDIGWSLACGRQKLNLGWDGRVTNRHVMDPATLQAVDPRVGF